MNRMHCTASFLLLGSALAAAADLQTWKIPLGGNAYRTAGDATADGRIVPRGIERWSHAKTEFSVYFRVDRAAELELALDLRVPEGKSQLRLSAGGEDFDQEISGAETHPVVFGDVHVEAPGYLRVDLRGLEKQGEVFADVESLSVSSATAGLELVYVRDNEDNRFYWGRRGPSVHLGYVVPKDETIEYFYSELTVPVGEDPIGSYFMANGFSEGYFGIQVNSEDQRKILFSVWSPFSTDRPSEIPEDQRVQLLAKGESVHGGEFGGEGSGGQSYLVYPWEAGNTYSFLTRAHPDGAGNTIYSAWFRPTAEPEWQLIASFLRPRTNKHLTGIHGFLENFADRHGFEHRRANYGNQWIRNTEGNWIEVTRARFTGDDLATRGDRLDFAGGSEDGMFFLRNGGYFANPVELKSEFDRKAAGADRQPEIDLNGLDGNS